MTPEQPIADGPAAATRTPHSATCPKNEPETMEELLVAAASRVGCPFSYHYALFEHMSREHGLTLLESEMEEIESIVIRNYEAGKRGQLHEIR